MSGLYHSGRVLWVGALLVCLLAGSSFAAPELFVAEPTVDLGTIKEGEDAKHTFVIENRGDEALEIKGVKASCACTVPKGLRPEQRIIPPGQSIELPVEFKSKNRPGKTRSRVTIKSNDPKKPTFDVSMTVTVDVLCVVMPQQLYFTNARRGEVAPRTVNLLPGKKDATLEVLELKSTNPGLEVITEPYAAAGAGDRKGVRVSVRIGGTMPLGRVSAQLKGKVRVGDKEKELQIPVAGQVVGDVMVLPPFITRTTPIKRDVRVGEIIVRANQSAEVSVKAAIPRSDLLVTEVVEQEARKDYRVKINLAKDAPGGPFATVVDVYTSSSQMPIASVPVFVNAESLVEVTPDWVYLPASGGPGTKRLIMLSAQGDMPLTVEEVACDDPAIVVRVIPDPAKKNVAEVEVSLKPDAKGNDHYSLLRIKTNIPGADRLEVPVLAAGEEAKKASVSQGPTIGGAVRPGGGG